MKLILNKTEGRLPTSNYFLFDGDKEIGFSQIRHTPSQSPEFPDECASHIFYEIHKEFRGKGYGSKLLALAIDQAKILGISKIALSCLKNNIASQKIIKKSGGKFKGEYHGNHGQILLMFTVE